MTSLRQTALRDAVFRLKATPQCAGASRHLSKSAWCRDASQPASAAAQNPHAARVAAANASNATSGGDARSRLAKLQAQRLEELNRGRSGSGGAGRPNRPEQKWSNRTLIALATSVGACTYLMGTYQGYNAGKAHAEQEQEQAEASGLAPLKAASGVTASHPNVDGSNGTGSSAQAQASIPLLGALPDALAQLLPMTRAGSAVQCEPQHGSSTQRYCRLAELTQYHCDFHANRVVCQPIDRIFRM